MVYFKYGKKRLQRRGDRMKKGESINEINKKSKLKKLKENKELLFLTIPGTLWFLIFAYLPMFGVVLAFKDWRINGGFIKNQNLKN